MSMFFFRGRKSSANLNTSRVEAFSDGVFAVAITLLVLSITVPELSEEALLRGELVDHIIFLWPKVLSYIISFAIIGIFWVGHHIMFHYIKKSNRIFLWMNLLFLMVISFIPFPAALLGEYGGERVSVVLYGLTLMIAGIMFEAMWWYASSHKRLVDENLDKKIIRLGHNVVLVAPIAYFVAVIVALVNPILSDIIYILIPLLYIFPGKIDEIVNYISRESSIEKK